MKAYMIILLLILGNLSIAEAAQDQIIAIVNDEVITQSEFEEFLSLMYMDLSTKYDKQQLDEQKQNLASTALKRLIEDRLILQEARRQEIEVSDKEVNKRLDSIKSDFSSQAQFEDVLSQQGLIPAALKKQLRDQALMEAIVDKQVRSKVNVSPTEVTVYFQGHIQEFMTRPSRYVDSIFVKTKELADKILDLIEQGIDFTSLIQQYSQNPNIGWVTRGQLLKDIEDVIFSLNLGQVSDIIKTEEGYYIFKVIKAEPSRAIQLNEVQDEIFNLLLQKKINQRYTEWLEDLKQDAYIYIKQED